MGNRKMKKATLRPEVYPRRENSGFSVEKA